MKKLLYLLLLLLALLLFWAGYRAGYRAGWDDATQQQLAALESGQTIPPSQPLDADVIEETITIVSLEDNQPATSPVVSTPEPFVCPATADAQSCEEQQALWNRQMAALAQQNKQAQRAQEDAETDALNRQQVKNVLGAGALAGAGAAASSSSDTATTENASSNTRKHGIAAGDHLVKAHVGVGFGLQDSGMRVTSDTGIDNRVDWGEKGNIYAISYHYLATDRLGIGAEVSRQFFDGTSYDNTMGSITDEFSAKTYLTQLMASLRWTFNPYAPVRFYVPFGVGLVHARTSASFKNGSGLQNATSRTDSLGYFAGLGMEMDLAPRVLLGLETRYTGFSFYTDRLASQLNNVSGSGKQYSALSLAVHLGYRF